MFDVVRAITSAVLFIGLLLVYVPAQLLPGSRFVRTSNTFDQGVDWQVLSGGQVVNGTLSVIPTTTEGARGLAGFQIVSVPEPNVSILAEASALITAIFLRRRR